MQAELHCFGESGNAYKAALALELAGISWRPVFVVFFRGATWTQDFRRLNPMGEVPVLVAGDTVLSQSGVIQDWVIERSGRFGGSGPAERREVWRWVLFDNQKLSGIAGPLRFNLHFLPPEKRRPEVEAFLQMRLTSALKVLEARLADREWLAADQVTAADLSCCGYLYYDEPFGFDRTDWPAIDAWLDRMAALPGWRHPYDIMPRALPGSDAAPQDRSHERMP